QRRSGRILTANFKRDFLCIAYVDQLRWLRVVIGRKEQSSRGLLRHARRNGRNAGHLLFLDSLDGSDNGIEIITLAGPNDRDLRRERDRNSNQLPGCFRARRDDEAGRKVKAHDAFFRRSNSISRLSISISARSWEIWASAEFGRAARACLNRSFSSCSARKSARN
ncbi:MAG: hypothetical protein AAGF56_13035, partial [Pseudomonadota bacterium]